MGVAAEALHQRRPARRVPHRAPQPEGAVRGGGCALGGGDGADDGDVAPGAAGGVEGEAVQPLHQHRPVARRPPAERKWVRTREEGNRESEGSERETVRQREGGQERAREGESERERGT